MNLFHNNYICTCSRHCNDNNLNLMNLVQWNKEMLFKGNLERLCEFMAIRREYPVALWDLTIGPNDNVNMVKKNKINCNCKQLWMGAKPPRATQTLCTAEPTHHIYIWFRIVLRPIDWARLTGLLPSQETEERLWRMKDPDRSSRRLGEEPKTLVHLSAKL